MSYWHWKPSTKFHPFVHSIVVNFSASLYSQTCLTQNLSIYATPLGFSNMFYSKPLDLCHTPWFLKHVLLETVRSMSHPLVSQTCLTQNLSIYATPLGFSNMSYSRPFDLYHTPWFHKHVLLKTVRSMPHPLVSQICLTQNPSVYATPLGFSNTSHSRPFDLYDTPSISIRRNGRKPRVRGVKFFVKMERSGLIKATCFVWKMLGLTTK